MASQPWLKYYIGDYIKDTRMLPLNVRGGWNDLMLYMWENKVKGELQGTYSDFALYMNCTEAEAILVIQTIKQKNICDYAELGDGIMKLVSRKQKAMVALSETRQNSGKNGGNPALVKQNNNNGLQKKKQKSESESESESECINEKRSVDQFKADFENDYKTDQKVCMENGFSPEHLSKAKTWFWNRKELDSEMVNKTFQDVQLHFINWCNMHKDKIKKKDKGSLSESGNYNSEEVYSNSTTAI